MYWVTIRFKVDMAETGADIYQEVVKRAGPGKTNCEIKPVRKKEKK